MSSNMNDFSTAELALMRSVQVDSLQDLCVIQRHAYTGDSYGQQVSSWTDDASATACGLDMRPGSERFSDRSAVLTYDATLRLAITETVDEKDRIKITRRYGSILATPLVFEVAGPPQQGVSGIRLLLKRIET